MKALTFQEMTTQLTARENIINNQHQKSFKSYKLEICLRVGKLDVGRDNEIEINKVHVNINIGRRRDGSQ